MIYQRPRTSRPGPGHRIYPYLLRGLCIERVHQVWAADITYVPMAQGFLYLVAVIEWFSRYVPGISFAGTKRFEHPTAALAEHIRHYGSQLNIGVFEHLLKALFVLADLTHQVLAGAGQVAQFLDRSRRHQARRISPCASRSAIQVASLTSLLRPGTLRICAGLARRSSSSPSRMCHTGFQ